MEDNPITAILDGYIPSTILANFFNIESKRLKATTLDSIKYKNVKLIKIPLTAVKFINSREYQTAVLEENEDEREYDYVLTLSKNLKVGFWK